MFLTSLPPHLRDPLAQRPRDLLPPDQILHALRDHHLPLPRILQGLERLDELARRAPPPLDLERLVARHAARAHEHLEEDVAQREHVRLGGQGGEGRGGDGERGGGVAGAEIVQEAEVGGGGGEGGVCAGDEGYFMGRNSWSGGGGSR